MIAPDQGLGGSLAGVRVLDFTMNLPGPYATMVLSSLGAEVVKIEPPRGDTARTFARLFDIVNAGKKSVVLDLKLDASAATVRALLAAADVVVEGFRPGVMARFGCDAEAALRINPRLVYCSISGFGQAGPYVEYPGHDLNFQALTGVCHMMRDSEGRPLGCALPIADLSSAMTAVTAVLAALIERQRTGAGKIIDVAMTDTLLSWAYAWSEGLTPSDGRLSSLVGPARRWLVRAERGSPAWLRPVVGRVREGLLAAGPDRVDAVGDRLRRSRSWQQVERLRLHALPHYTIYRTRDDRWLSVGIVDEDKFWAALCEAVGLAPLGSLPMLARFLAGGPLRRLLALQFRRRDLADWLRRLDRTKIPVAPVLTVAEALADLQIMERRVSGAAHVHAPFPLSPPKSETDAAVPTLGEHTDAVLRAWGAVR